jgi:tetratricopeptide (TPR) repeat protein
MRAIFIRYILYTLILYVLTGCAGKSQSVSLPEEKESSLTHLPGVDSLVAARALMMVDTAFVSVEEEENAEQLLDLGKREFTESDTLNSLKKILELAQDSTLQVTTDDSAKAITHLNRAFGHYEEVEKLFDSYLEGGGTTESLGGEILERLTDAREATIQAIRYNPFDMDARLLLSVIYRYLARIFGDEENYHEAIRVLNELIEMDRGDHSLQYELGFNHYQIQGWEEALSAFQRAEELLYENAALEETPLTSGETSSMTEGEVPDEGFTSIPVDTATLLNYVWYQADCQTRLYLSDGAVDSYRRALALAKSDEDRDELQGSIDWILWDDGNILNVKARDSIIRVEREGDYTAARKAYSELLPGLSGETAVDEVDWKIATIDYQFLDEKNMGIERLRGLIDRAIERGIVNQHGAVTDASSPYVNYVNDYGIMCFNLGMDYLTGKQRRREAFTYFLQATEVEWRNRGSSFVELLKLASNNPSMTITYGEQALEHNLSQEERIYVLKQLTNAYKRKGSRADFEKARYYFNEWKRLAKSQN